MDDILYLLRGRGQRVAGDGAQEMAGARPLVQRTAHLALPGIHALNFVLHEAPDGGITSSPRLDKVAKAVAQQLLQFPVPVPAALVER